MSRTARLGAFIVGALIFLAIGIFLIGDRQFAFSNTYRLKAPFDNVAGLDDSAPVRAGGVRVGTVERLQLPRQAGEKIIVELELEESTRGVIKKDSVASIETEGLLGNKYVAVSFGSKEGESVRDGDTIQSQPPLDYADLAKKAGEVADSAKLALNNVNEATTDLKSITSQINRGEGTIGALIKDKQVYNSLNATTQDIRKTAAEAKTGMVSFQENMEALKHNWFLRGFFKDRGYFDSSDLTVHAVAELPNRPAVRKFVFSDKDLFNEADSAKLKKEKILNEAGKFLEQHSYDLAVVTAYTGLKGEKAENLTLTQARAAVVRQYLAKKFRVDDTRIKTKGMGESGEIDPHKADRVEVIVYSDNQSAAVQK
jgi:phospholipid/cholesterol/gamma-HCH transport system substrate-binding protein